MAAVQPAFSDAFAPVGHFSAWLGKQQPVRFSQTKEQAARLLNWKGSNSRSTVGFFQAGFINFLTARPSWHRPRAVCRPEAAATSRFPIATPAAVWLRSLPVPRSCYASLRRCRSRCQFPAKVIYLGASLMLIDALMTSSSL